MAASRTVRLAAAILLGAALNACGGPGNAPPNADAGDTPNARVGSAFTLDGSGSSDPDGDALTYGWAFAERPEGSAAAFEDPATVAPTATPDVEGDYEVVLTVDDGRAEAQDSLTISAGAANETPLALAGSDRVIDFGDEASLDGRASSDPDGDALSYAWAVEVRPDGSSAEPSDATRRAPTFTPDVAGRYTLSLTVSDGEAEASDTVEVRANRLPSADAGADVEGRVTEALTLAGSGSDADGDALGYAWSFLSRPTGSTTTLSDADTPTASFTPDVDGLYLLELTVSDGHREAADTVEVNAIPASGVVSSQVFVAVDGDDANPGTKAEPFATLQAALNVVHAEPDVTRVRFAPGTYDAEPFDYHITADAQLVGPDASEGHATLSAAGDLLSVGGDASVALVRLALTSPSRAMFVDDDASVDLVEVACEAERCISTGQLLFGAPGGRVGLVRSTLSAAVAGSGTGVSSTAGDGLSMRDTEVEGFATGVAVMSTPLTLRNATFRNPGTGLSLFAVEEAHVQDSTFIGQERGITATAANGVHLEGVLVDGSGTVDVRIDGGSVRLTGSTLRSGDGDGIVLGENATGGEVVTLRDTTVESHLGDSVAVHGADSILDLGTPGESGNNALTFSKGYGIHDRRDADASGQITLRDTILDSPKKPQPPAGTYTTANDGYDMRIEASGNEIIVY